MLDECKGERLEEVLAVFSNAVLKRFVQEQESGSQSVAQQLALENFSYSGERTILSTLILAHKASLRNHLLAKNDSRAQYDDFSNLLQLNDRRITRRHEQLKQLIEERISRYDISDGEIKELRDHVQKNWSGSDDWLDTILYGESKVRRDGLLGTRFDRVWKHVESGSIGDIEGEQRIGLIEQLDARVRDQEARLARWQEFGRTFSKTGYTSPTKQKETEVPQGKKIDLSFNRHQSLQIGRNSEKTTPALPSLDEYARLVESLANDLADVGKPQKPDSEPARQNPPHQTQPVVSSPIPQKDEPPTDEEWSSASNTEEPSPNANSHGKSTSQTPPSEAPMLEISEKISRVVPPPKKKTSLSISTRSTAQRGVDAGRNVEVSRKDRAHSPQRCTKSTVQAPLAQSPESESELADQILNSVSASSPSPKKPRHTLSLAERTRLSMSRASHSKYSDLHDDVDNLADLTRLSIRTKPSQPVKKSLDELDEEKHADLIERTRKSMAGFEAAQKKAQTDRRKSVKDAKKKQRESSYFPKVEEEPLTPSINPVELIDGDPDYESVFKSRPKIKTSPAVSPTRIWEDEGED